MFQSLGDYSEPSAHRSRNLKLTTGFPIFFRNRSQDFDILISRFELFPALCEFLLAPGRRLGRSTLFSKRKRCFMIIHPSWSGFIATVDHQRKTRNNRKIIRKSKIFDIDTSRIRPVLDKIVVPLPQFHCRTRLECRKLFFSGRKWCFMAWKKGS